MTRIRTGLFCAALLLAAQCAQAANPYGFSRTSTPPVNDASLLVPNTGWVQNLVSTNYLALAGGSLTGTLSVPQGVSVVSGVSPNANQVVANGLASSSSANTITMKNGPSGNIMLKVGGTNADIEPQVTTLLPGLAWTGTGDQAPITQNATFTGTTTNGKAGFGLWLNITDNSNCESTTTGFCGVVYSHVDLGASTQGHRNSGMFELNVNAPTLNTTGFQYSALRATANIMANDAPSGTPFPGATVFAFNAVAHVKAGKTANQINAAENDIWAEAGSVIEDRLNSQYVDVLGGSGAPTYGQQAIRDDMQAFYGMQYPPCYFAGATATQSGTTLTVTAPPGSGSVAVGCVVSGANITTAENITALGTGSGGNGTYTTNVSQTAASGTVNGVSGYKTVLSIGRAGGFPSVAPNGTIFGGQGNAGTRFSLANGIDWSLGDASGYWLQFGTVASLSGAGVMKAASYQAGATTGVTCSGAPSASFASIGGIITHC